MSTRRIRVVWLASILGALAPCARDGRATLPDAAQVVPASPAAPPSSAAAAPAASGEPRRRADRCSPADGTRWESAPCGLAPYCGFAAVAVDAGTAGRAAGAPSAGMFVHWVDPGGPAARHGLRAGDVITAVNGRAAVQTDGLAAVLALADGRAMGLEVRRHGAAKPLVIALAGEHTERCPSKAGPWGDALLRRLSHHDGTTFLDPPWPDGPARIRGRVTFDQRALVCDLELVLNNRRTAVHRTAADGSFHFGVPAGAYTYHGFRIVGPGALATALSGAVHPASEAEGRFHGRSTTLVVDHTKPATLGTIVLASPIEIESPLHDRTYDARDAVVSWKPHPGAASYSVNVIQILMQRGWVDSFESKIQASKVTATRWKWLELPGIERVGDGTYQVEIVARDSDGQLLSVSRREPHFDITGTGTVVAEESRSGFGWTAGSIYKIGKAPPADNADEEVQLPPGTALLTGRIVLDGRPAAGLRPTIRFGGNRSSLATPTDAQGRYEVHVPPGRYDVVSCRIGFAGKGGDPEVPIQPGGAPRRRVRVRAVAGGAATIPDVQLVSPLKLLEPADGAEQTLAALGFSWQGHARARRYRFCVSRVDRRATWALYDPLFTHTVDGTRIAARDLPQAASLTPGEYAWSVEALDARGRRITASDSSGAHVRLIGSSALDPPSDSR